ncbi:DUF397 domain-containing protein [Actinoallomurus purpureus]
MTKNVTPDGWQKSVRSGGQGGNCVEVKVVDSKSA